MICSLFVPMIMSDGCVYMCVFRNLERTSSTVAVISRTFLRSLKQMRQLSASVVLQSAIRTSLAVRQVGFDSMLCWPCRFVSLPVAHLLLFSIKPQRAQLIAKIDASRFIWSWYLRNCSRRKLVSQDLFFSSSPLHFLSGSLLSPLFLHRNLDSPLLSRQTLELEKRIASKRSAAEREAEERKKKEKAEEQERLRREKAARAAAATYFPSPPSFPYDVRLFLPLSLALRICPLFNGS